MNFTYLDTSVYLRILLAQKNHEKIQKFLVGRTLATSSLMFFEAERGLVHASRQKQISSSEYNLLRERLLHDQEGFCIRDVAMDLCLNGRFPAVLTPKTPDLVHIRTALFFFERKQLDVFATTDKHQRDSAIDLGLPVIFFD